MEYLNRQIVVKNDPSTIETKPILVEAGTLFVVTFKNGTKRLFVFIQIESGIYKYFDTKDVTNRFSDQPFTHKENALPHLQKLFYATSIEEFKE